MKPRLAPVAAVFLLAVGASRASELIVHSPAEFADDVAETVATGPCGTAEEPIILDRTTLIRTLVEFPGDFLDGLVPVVRFGHTSYPISVQLDAATGTALFRNAEETTFYTVAPSPGTPPLATLLQPGTDPAGVVIHWRVLPQSDNPAPLLRSIPRLRSEDPTTNLCFTAIDALTNGVSLTLAWPTNAVFPQDVLDLYFAENLHGPWGVLRTLDALATNATASVFLTPAEIPSYTNAPPPHIHDASCSLVTNVAPNIFSGGVAVTNIRWMCSTNRPSGAAPAGFFRAGTRLDTDGDGLPDAFETIVLGTDPDSEDTDGDGLLDSAELDLDIDPLLADTDGDGISDGDEVGFARPMKAPRSIGPFNESNSTNLLAVETASVDDMIWTRSLSESIDVDSNRYDRISIDLNGWVHFHQVGVTNVYWPTYSPVDLGSWSPVGDAEHDIAVAAVNGCDLVADPANGARVWVWKSAAFHTEILCLQNLSVSGESATNGLLSMQIFIPHHPMPLFGRDVTVTFTSLPDSFLANPPSLGIQNRRFRSHSALSAFAHHAVTLAPSLRNGNGRVSYALRAGTGTDPLVADSDADGLSDAEEIFHTRTDPLNPDTDGDGLSDAGEIDAGVNPHSPDTDGDGLPDGWEVAHGFNPVASGEESLDSDSDGLANAEEFALGTNPTEADSDGDGIGDGQEALYGTDPLDADSDDDGMPDGWEAAHGLDPADADDAAEDADGDGLTNAEEYDLGTNIEQPDTDGDGVSDGMEVSNETDPLDPSDWRAPEWFVLTANGAEGMPVARTWMTTIPAGLSSLVAVFSQSDEYPTYTEDESQFNDILEWLVWAPGNPSLQGEIDVNSRHGIWELAELACVGIRGHSPVCVESMGFFTAPANEALSVQVTLGGANIADSQLPSTLVVGVFPLELSQANMPTPTGIDGSTDGTNYHRALIPQQGIAYVTAQPAAAALSAQIKGLPDFFDVDWRFDLEGERAERNPTDSRHRPENTTDRYHIVGDAVMDIAVALSNEIVGGSARLSVAVSTYYSADAALRAESRTPFAIRGKNPLDATARDYIDAAVDAEFQDFAWAIARHESWERVNSRAYNQFNPNAAQSFFEQPNKTVPVPPATNAWGFGMAQIDRGEDGRTTDVAWDWHTNIAEMNRVLRQKQTDYRRLIGYYRNAYGNTPLWNEPPDAFSVGGVTLSAEGWGIIILNNGAGGVPHQSTSMVSDFQSPWEYIPGTGTWVFHQNSNSYATRIVNEMNSTGATE